MRDSHMPTPAGFRPPRARAALPRPDGPVIERLESRLLLSASTPDAAVDDLVQIKWRGRDVMARPNEWLVKVEDVRGAVDRQMRALDRAFRRAGAPVAIQKHLGADGLVLVRSNKPISRGKLRASLRGVGGFKYMEPNVVFQIAALPDDPQFPLMYNLHNTGQSDGTEDADIDAPEAWEISTGSPDVVIGVIDTGVEWNHRDLAANIWTNPWEIPGDGIDNDNNGYIDDVRGWDFANDDNDPMDDNGHGTHVAGIIAAVGNNAVNSAGVSWNSKIMPLKFIAGNGNGEAAAAVAALNYATMMRQRGVNIRVTNNSWGDSIFLSAIYEAVQAHEAAGMLFVAAVGNSGRDIDASPFYPAAFDLPNVISVAGTDRFDELASFSNFGAASVHLGAPGKEILSTYLNGTTFTFSGTSLASPHVAGVAALALSISPPETSYQTIRDAILMGADPLDSLAGKTITGRRLNAFGALMQLPMSVLSTSPAAGQVTGSRPIDFILTFSHPYDASSVQPAAFQVNGTPASGFTATDSKTIAFHFDESPVAVEGLQSMSLAAGAVTRSPDGDPVGGFNADFRYDAVGLRVSGTTPGDGQIVTPPLTSLEIRFNKPLDPASIDAAALVLTQGMALSAALVAPDTVRFGLSGVTREGPLGISLPAGSLTDLFGNPAEAWTASLQLDVEMIPLPLLPSAPLASGASAGVIDGSINFPTDTDSFTIQAAAGQTLSLALDAPPSLQALLELRDPSGELLRTISAGDGPALLLDSLTLTLSGTYIVTVTGASAGDYTLTAALGAALESEKHGGPENDSLETAHPLDSGFTHLAGPARRAVVIGRTDPPPGILEREIEPNNFIPQANSGTLNFRPSSTDLYHLGIQGEITDSGDSDYFNIGHLDSGALLSITVSGADGRRGTLVDPQIELYRGSPDMPIRVIDADDNGPGLDAALHRMRIDVADTYYIRAKLASRAPGTYALGVWLENSAAPPLIGAIVASELEPNDTAPEANDLSSAWQRVEYTSSTLGHIASGDRDFYVFDLSEGDLLSLRVESLSTLDTAVNLRDSAGNIVASEDGESPGARLDAPIYGYRVPAAGRYYIETFARSGTGDYELQVHLSPAISPPPAPPHGADYYSFELARAERATLLLHSADAAGMALEVHDADGTVLATAPAPSGGLSLIDVFEAPESGRYFVRISGERDVDYTLLITASAAIDLGENDTFTTAQPIANVSGVAGHLTAGDEDFYRFHVSANELLHLRLSLLPAEPESPEATLELLDPAGNPVGSANLTPDAEAVLVHRALIEGDYRARIFFAGGESGAVHYFLRLTNFSSGLAGSRGDDLYQIRIDQSAEHIEIFEDIAMDGSNGSPASAVAPSATPAFILPRSLLDILTLDPGEGDDTIIIDFSQTGSSPPIDLVRLNLSAGDDSIQIIGGAAVLAIAADPPSPGPVLTVEENASAILSTGPRLQGLDIASSGRVSLPAGADRPLRLDLSMSSTPSALSLAPGAILDLADNALIIQLHPEAAPEARQAVLETLSAWIATARNGGKWNGSGITSASARNDPSALTGLAIMLNRNAAGHPIYTEFAGEPVDENAILIRYTRNGDMDLNGVIDIDDYFLIDTGFLDFQSGLIDNPTHMQGDLDFNGIIDIDDYFLIDTAYLAQQAPL